MAPIHADKQYAWGEQCDEHNGVPLHHQLCAPLLRLTAWQQQNIRKRHACSHVVQSCSHVLCVTINAVVGSGKQLCEPSPYRGEGKACSSLWLANMHTRCDQALLKLPTAFCARDTEASCARVRKCSAAEPVLLTSAEKCELGSERRVWGSAYSLSSPASKSMT